MKIEPNLVPENLRDLIPVAIKWLDFLHKPDAEMSQGEANELSNILHGRREHLEDWFYGSMGDDAQEHSHTISILFADLLVIELGHAGGPGVCSGLEWAIRNGDNDRKFEVQEDEFANRIDGRFGGF